MGKSASKATTEKRNSSSQVEERTVRPRVTTTTRTQDPELVDKVQVQTLGGKVLIFDLDPTTTVRQLKEEIHLACNIHPSTQRLLHSDQEADDQSKLCDVDLNRGLPWQLLVSAGPVLLAEVPMDDVAVSEALLAETCYFGGLDLRRCQHLTDATASLIADNPQYHDGITFLNLEYNKGMTADGLTKLFVHMHCLNTAQLRAVRGMNDTALRALCCASGAKLRKLDVSCCNISKDGLLAVAACCPHLTEICLDGVVVEESAVLALTRSCTKLLAMHLQQVPLSVDTISALAGQVPKLEHLSVYVDTSVGDSGKILAALKTLITSHQVLVELQLALSSEVSIELELPCVLGGEAAFRKLLLASPKLRTLQFRGVESPEALIRFMKAVEEVGPQLETFEISCMNGLRGGFALCCKDGAGSNLQEERRLLRAIAACCGASLQHIVISKGCNVSPAEIHAIASSCPALRKLDLSHSGHGIQEDDVVQLSLACTHLESLNLAFNDRMNLLKLRECPKCQPFWIPPGQAACSACGARL